MPRIPGVTQATPSAPGLQLKPLLTVITIALVCAFAFAFWLLHRRSADSETAMTGAAAVPQTLPSAPPDADSDPDANAVGTLYELAAPWSSKNVTPKQPSC